VLVFLSKVNPSKPWLAALPISEGREKKKQMEGRKRRDEWKLQLMRRNLKSTRRCLD